MLFVLEKRISYDGNIGWLEGGMLVWCFVFGISLDNVGGGCVCFGKNAGAPACSWIYSFVCFEF